MDAAVVQQAQLYVTRAAIIKFSNDKSAPMITNRFRGQVSREYRAHSPSDVSSQRVNLQPRRLKDQYVRQMEHDTHQSETITIIIIIIIIVMETLNT